MTRNALARFCLLATLLLPTLAGAADVDVISAEFGLFEENQSGEITFLPTKVVPQAVGQRYGWIIELRTRKRSLAVREEYVLPPTKESKVPDTPIARNLHIPDLRRTQVSQRQLVPFDNQIVGEWSVGPTEPAGKRKLHVIVEGEAVAAFEFEVK